MLRCDELSIDVAWDFVLVSRGMLRFDTPTIAKKLQSALLFCFQISEILQEWRHRWGGSGVP